MIQEVHYQNVSVEEVNAIEYAFKTYGIFCTMHNKPNIFTYILKINSNSLIIQINPHHVPLLKRKPPFLQYILEKYNVILLCKNYNESIIREIFPKHLIQMSNLIIYDMNKKLDIYIIDGKRYIFLETYLGKINIDDITNINVNILQIQKNLSIADSLDNTNKHIIINLSNIINKYNIYLVKYNSTNDSTSAHIAAVFANKTHVALVIKSSTKPNMTIFSIIKHYEQQDKIIIIIFSSAKYYVNFFKYIIFSLNAKINEVNDNLEILDTDINKQHTCFIISDAKVNYVTYNCINIQKYNYQRIFYKTHTNDLLEYPLKQQMQIKLSQEDKDYLDEMISRNFLKINNSYNKCIMYIIKIHNQNSIIIHLNSYIGNICISILDYLTKKYNVTLISKYIHTKAIKQIFEEDINENNHIEYDINKKLSIHATNNKYDLQILGHKSKLIISKIHHQSFILYYMKVRKNLKDNHKMTKINSVKYQKLIRSCDDVMNIILHNDTANYEINFYHIIQNKETTIQKKILVIAYNKYINIYLINNFEFLSVNIMYLIRIIDKYVNNKKTVNILIDKPIKRMKFLSIIALIFKMKIINKHKMIDIQKLQNKSHCIIKSNHFRSNDIDLEHLYITKRFYIENYEIIDVDNSNISEYIL